MRFLRILTVMLPFLATPALAQSAPIKVVATTGMIADAASQIGGDLIELKTLMGAGVDPHSFRQTRSDILALMNADLILWNGLYLEAQLEPLLLDLAQSRTVVAVAEAIPQDRLRSHPEYEDRFDPHVWMDPTLWRTVVLAVRDALSASYPEGAAIFEANAIQHLAEIDRLTAYAQSSLSSVPEATRVLVTAHDAFGYFGRAFDLEVLGIQGISTASEAGLLQISTLVDTLVMRQIGAIFVESSVSDRNIRALQEGAAAQGHAVAIGGELYSDAMGPEGSYEGAYIGMLDHNITTITRALGGTAPEGGMNGALTP
ncbi:metal ABC transporter solute-binding protein, Zn/Mn family [Roseobacter sp. HKCCD5988]|uniref:metal ABC transporter solute-binding protein, Zn/Mn family n=1 Tax=Roseobacter sp. HKCCD5988 TaxID=3120338 RepID=UPI0030ECA797